MVDTTLELTERELVILRLLSKGGTDQSIAQFLGNSESTIRREIMRIFARLGCKSRSEATEIYRGYSSTSKFGSFKHTFSRDRVKLAHGVIHCYRGVSLSAVEF